MTRVDGWVLVLLAPSLHAAGPPAARELWAVRHDEPARAVEQTGSLLIDGDGNVYIAGGSQRSAEEGDVLVTLTKVGGKEVLWRTEVGLFSSTPAAFFDQTGDIVLAGVEGIVKYDPQGPACGHDPRTPLACEAGPGC